MGTTALKHFQIGNFFSDHGIGKTSSLFRHNPQQLYTTSGLFHQIARASWVISRVCAGTSFHQSKFHKVAEQGWGTTHELVSSHFSWVVFSQPVVQVLPNLLLKKIQISIGPLAQVCPKCVFLIAFLIYQPFHLL